MLTFFILLGVILSIGVSIEHPGAILNILVLIFLFFYSLISTVFKKNKSLKQEEFIIGYKILHLETEIVFEVFLFNV